MFPKHRIFSRCSTPGTLKIEFLMQLPSIFIQYHKNPMAVTHFRIHWPFFTVLCLELSPVSRFKSWQCYCRKWFLIRSKSRSSFQVLGMLMGQADSSYFECKHGECLIPLIRSLTNAQKTNEQLGSSISFIRSSRGLIWLSSNIVAIMVEIQGITTHNIAPGT